MRQALASFKNGTSGGIDGLRPQHIKDMLSCPNDQAVQSLLIALSNLCTLVFKGLLPFSIQPVFCGARLCALTKKGGGVRPIAIGNTIRRLMAKIASLYVGEKAGNLLRPVQLGYGTQQGCEAGVHAARHFLETAEGFNSSYAFLKIDFKNAFNSINRSVFLRECHEHFPGIYNFVSTCYLQPSHLTFDTANIMSSTGVQQGDPLGPLLFCLAIRKLTSKLKSDFNQWYLDDGVLGGDPKIVKDDYESIIEAGRELGLSINEVKCELVTNSDLARNLFMVQHPNIRFIDHSELTLLGSPLGVSSMKSALKCKREDLQRMATRLTNLNPHEAFFLLKNCLAIPKLIYILRTAPCFENEEYLHEYDALMKNSLEKITNNSLNDIQWLQATQPVKLGGLGIRSAHQLAPSCFLSSAVGCAPLCAQILSKCQHSQLLHLISSPQILSARQKWSILAKSNVATESLVSQKELDQVVVSSNNLHILELLKNHPVEISRLKSVSDKDASAWVNAIPVSSLGLKLSAEQLRISVGLRLGCFLCSNHQCICGSHVDPFGRHGLSCKKSAGRHSRHQEVNNIVHRALCSANIASTLEPAGLSRSDGKRPDGCTAFPWSQGKCLVWDFTCSDTFAPSHTNLASQGPGMIAKAAETKKHSKYKQLSRDFIVLPIAVETMGIWANEAENFFKLLGKKLATSSGEPRSKCFLMQRLSIAIQRGNSVSVTGTISPEFSYS